MFKIGKNPNYIKGLISFKCIHNDEFIMREDLLVLCSKGKPHVLLLYSHFLYQKYFCTKSKNIGIQISIELRVNQNFYLTS